MEQHEAGNLGSVETKDTKKEMDPQDRIPGRGVVNCPMTGMFHAVTEVEFCKNTCNFFKGFVEDDSKAPNKRRVDCRYPRYLEVIEVYGDNNRGKERG